MSQADSADTTTLPGAATVPAPANPPKAVKSPGKSRNRKGTAAVPPAAAAAGDKVVDLVAMIERMARDESVDPDRMERLLAVWERQRAVAAEQEFNRAMAAAQAEMEPVRANCRNDQTRSKYASYDALNEAIRPVYTAYGFSITFDTEPIPAAPPINVADITGLTERILLTGMEHGFAPDQIDRLIDRAVAAWKAISPPPADAVLIVAYVSHSYVTPTGETAGHTRRYSIPMPCDGKGARGNDVMTRTHALGSAYTYGRRYLLCGAFDIPVSRDDDGNAAGRRAATPVTNAVPARTLAARPPDNPALTRRTYGPATVAPSPLSRLRADLEASAAMADQQTGHTTVTDHGAKLKAAMTELHAARPEPADAADFPAPAFRQSAASVPAPGRTAPGGPAPARSMEAQIDLDNRAYDAARKGAAGFRAFCPTITKEEFESLRPLLGEIEAIAKKADQEAEKKRQAAAAPAKTAGTPDDSLDFPAFLDRRAPR